MTISSTSNSLAASASVSAGTGSTLGRDVTDGRESNGSHVQRFVAVATRRRVVGRNDRDRGHGVVARRSLVEIVTDRRRRVDGVGSREIVHSGSTLSIWKKAPERDTEAGDTVVSEPEGTPYFPTQKTHSYH